MCWVPDIDNDGVDDVVVGIPLAGKPGAETCGRIDLLSGRDLAVIRSISGTQAGERFGSAIDSCNRYSAEIDRVLAIGSPGFNGTVKAAGLITIVALPNLQPITALGKELGGGGGINRPGSEFGASVRFLSDLNGDGVVEMAIGAPQGSLWMDHESGWCEVVSCMDSVRIDVLNWPGEEGTCPVFGSRLRVIPPLSSERGHGMLVVSAIGDMNYCGGVLLLSLDALQEKRDAYEAITATARFNGSHFQYK
jgi:hypothetical protein